MHGLCFLLVFVFACDVSKKNGHAMFPVFDKEGHRGCRGLMPENSIPAMIKAVDLGVTTLEMDTYVTHDQQVIVSHDPYFNHEISSKPDGSFISEKEEQSYVIYRMTYAETLRFDVGLKPYPRFPRQEKLAVHKPLLSELIDSVENYCRRNKRNLPFYNIETKSLPVTDHIFHPGPQEFVDLLMAVINTKRILSRVIIQSFDIRTLQIVHAKYPSLKTSLLVDALDKRDIRVQIWELGFTPSIYSPDYSRVNAALLLYCHEHGIKVIPWTVNTAEEISRLRKMGVDGIITDYPDLFSE